MLVRVYLIIPHTAKQPTRANGTFLFDHHPFYHCLRSSTLKPLLKELEIVGIAAI